MVLKTFSLLYVNPNINRVLDLVGMLSLVRHSLSYMLHLSRNSNVIARQELVGHTRVRLMPSAPYF
jgi:hypothetical protein